jgi:hypothetical protein
VRRVSRASALAVALAVAAATAACGGDDDGGDAGSATSTTMLVGDLEIPAPEGWQEIPLPTLGFGLAVPGGWEATRLDPQGLSSTNQASPVVPGFVEAAHAAASAGSVLYAAGVDPQGRVTDLKVRALLDSGITDVTGLEAYANQAATDAGLQSVQVTVVPEAPWPAVDVRFRSPSQRPADGGTAQGAAPVAVTVEGSERLVLSPRGTVFSLIVTSEDPAGHDALASQIAGTLAVDGA